MRSRPLVSSQVSEHFSFPLQHLPILPHMSCGSIRWKRIALLACIFMLPIFLFSTSAAVLFSDDFSGSMSQWSIDRGAWSIVNGELQGIGGGDAWIYAGNTAWTDYSLSCKINFENGNGELIVRNTGHWQNQYRITVWSQNSEAQEYTNCYNITRYKNGVPTVLTAPPAGNPRSPVPITDPCTVRVDAIGNQLVLYINGTQVTNVTDPDGLAAGGIGLGVIWDWIGYFDDVSVSEVGEATNSPISVRSIRAGVDYAVTFSNPLPASVSNRVYGIEAASSLQEANWEFQSSCAVVSTNAVLTLNAEGSNSCGFYRVRRMDIVAGQTQDTNTLGFVGHESGERIAILQDPPDALCYTASNGASAIIYVNTNGLPARVVDGDYIFLFENYTSNSVDIALVWPGGSNSIVRNVPLNAADLSKLAALRKSIASTRCCLANLSSQGMSREAALSLSKEEWKLLIDASITALSIAGCAVAIAGFSPTVVLSLAVAAACGGALYDTYKLAGGQGHIAADVGGTAINSFMCASIVGGNLGGVSDCVSLGLQIARAEIFDAEEVQAERSGPIEDALNQLQSSTTLDMISVQGGTVAGITVSSFRIGKYEVTWSEWQAARAEATVRGYDIGSRGSGCAGTHPVHTVNWYDVVKWCNLRSDMDGKKPVYLVGGNVYKIGQNNNVTLDAAANGYRLPTDAEGEYAARGGTQSQGYTYSGGNYLPDVGWYWYISGGAACYDDSGRGTWPVGGKISNELGLYDMSGNVREWCFDWYPGYEGSRRVARGGGWRDNSGECRVGFYLGSVPGNADYDLGFRVALPPGP